MKFKKPKFWDYKKQILISNLLFPSHLILILNNFLLINFQKKKMKI